MHTYFLSFDNFLISDADLLKNMVSTIPDTMAGTKNNIHHPKLNQTPFCIKNNIIVKVCIRSHNINFTYKAIKYLITDPSVNGCICQ